MDILDHEPVTSLGSCLEGVESNLLLTLSHGNICEGLVLVVLAVLGTDTLDIGSGVHTREEHEEGRSL